MLRTDAQQIIVDIGGIISNNVTNDTDFLIVGQQDYRVVGDDGMSNKQKKAVKLIEQGFTLEILSEEDFLKNHYTKVEKSDRITSPDQKAGVGVPKIITLSIEL